MSAGPGGHTPAVSRADIETAIRGAMVASGATWNRRTHRHLIDAVQELIEAEQAVDPSAFAVAEWTHARWIEGHEVVPVGVTFREGNGANAMSAQCMDCGEALVPARFAPVTGAPAVSRAEIEKAIGSCHVVRRFLDDVTMVSVPDAIDAVWALVSGADPAVHIVRESDIAAVKVERCAGGTLRTEGPRLSTGWGATISAEVDVARYEAELLNALAAQRFIEAEKAVDPVEVKAREIATIAYPESRFEGAFDVADNVAKAAYRRIARHLVWQETGQ